MESILDFLRENKPNAYKPGEIREGLEENYSLEIYTTAAARLDERKSEVESLRSIEDEEFYYRWKE